MAGTIVMEGIKLTGGYHPVAGQYDKGGSVLIDGGSASGTFTSCPSGKWVDIVNEPLYRCGGPQGSTFYIEANNLYLSSGDKKDLDYEKGEGAKLNGVILIFLFDQLLQLN